MSALLQQAVTYVQSPDNQAHVKASQDFLRGVLARATTDSPFRVELLTTPNTALARHAGLEVGPAVDIHFVENVAGGTTIVLPEFVGAEAELSEQELEAVAGGVTPVLVASAVASSTECIASAIGITYTIAKIAMD